MTATLIAPSSFPLRFAEVVNVRGDFGANELVNPKGVAFHPTLNAVLVTLTPNSQVGRVLILNAVKSDGSRAVFAPGYKPYRDVESMLAVVPASGPPVAAGFAAGDVFVNRGPHGQISRLSSAGAGLADVWTDLGSSGLLGGGHFQDAGSFGCWAVSVHNDDNTFAGSPHRASFGPCLRGRSLCRTGDRTWVVAPCGGGYPLLWPARSVAGS